MRDPDGRRESSVTLLYSYMCAWYAALFVDHGRSGTITHMSESWIFRSPKLVPVSF